MKLFFAFDLDGTLLDHQNFIHPKTISALQKTKEQGHVLAIATGRGLSATLEIANSFPYFDFLIANNGTLIYDYQNKQVYNNGAIESEIVLEVLKDCQTTNSICSLSSANQLYKFAPESNYDWLKNQHIMDINAYKDINIYEIGKVLESENITQISFRNQEDKITDLHKKWSAQLLNKYKTTITNRIFLDINPLKVDKWEALKFALVKSGLNNQHLVTFGDSSNDYEMIKNARLGYAMGGCTPDIAEIATKVIGSCTTDAIGNQVEYILENKEKLF